MKIWNGTTTAPGAMPLRPLGEAGVADDDLGIGRDRIDGEVLDRHVVLLQPLAHLAGDHHAAAHPGIAGDDDLADVPAVELRHVGSRSSWRRGRLRSRVSATGCSDRPKPSSIDATPNDTTEATAISSRTPKKPSLGVTAM